MADPGDREIESGEEIERLVYFSDAVFAIAITLLALNLQVPEIPDNLVATELPQRLLGLWPKFLGFFITFWVIGFFWMAHHRSFRYIKGYDRGLIRINFLFLMWIVLLPFSASLLSEYGDQQISVIVYAGHMIVSGLTLSWLWRHAVKDSRLVDPEISPRLVRYNNARSLALPSVFLLSIAISFVDVTAAEYSWLLSALTRPALLWYARRVG